MASSEAASENPTRAREVLRHDNTAARQLLTRGLDALGMVVAAIVCCAPSHLASRLWHA